MKWVEILTKNKLVDSLKHKHYINAAYRNRLARYSNKVYFAGEHFYIFKK